MNRTNRILPVYAGDVSGACSALFELGGMVVIHDPSGCNSTYNTHDETRWYDHDSLIFITGLTERDAILGNDEKLVRDVVTAARELHPRFVALCNSPIPYITGTDFVALCKTIEHQTSIPCFYVPTCGMHDYTVGASHALAEVAKRFVVPGERRAQTANVLGVTPLDFSAPGSAEALRGFVESAGFEQLSCWAMGSSLDDLARAAGASVSLVVSSTGLAAAKVLYERFGMPYVVGTPKGAFTPVLAEALGRAAQTGECLRPCSDARSATPDGLRCVVGEPVAAASLAAARELAGEEPLRVVCPVEMGGEVLLPSDAHVDGEQEVAEALALAGLVVADPFYEQVCPPGARFEAIPHLAFSGRGVLPNPLV